MNKRRQRTINKLHNEFMRYSFVFTVTQNSNTRYTYTLHRRDYIIDEHSLCYVSNNLQTMVGLLDTLHKYYNNK